jgi:hypothetical protein
MLDTTREYIENTGFQTPSQQQINLYKLQEMPKELRGKIKTEDYLELMDKLNLYNMEVQLPHTAIFIDDCIDLFHHRGELFKKLFENRQPRITYFLGLQDITGIPPSLKSNMDSLILFGGFPRQKWNQLFYQIPINRDKETFFAKYSELKKTEYLIITFDLDGTTVYAVRDSV